MLFCARQQWLLATFSFAAATAFRSNGMFLAGFLIWGLLVEPSFPRLPRFSIRSLFSTIYAAILTLVVFLPFLYHNYTGYTAFCISDASARPDWCSRTVPSIYTHVQSKYWGGGLFKYWTLQQLPNILLGAPPLILLFTFGAWHLRSVLQTISSSYAKSTAKLQDQATTANPEADNTPFRNPPNPFTSLSLTPHVIHSLFMSSVLLFASHTQIVLRLGAAMPTLYWSAAWLWHQPNRDRSSQTYGRWWVYWSAIWGMLSIVLWVAFLPPA
jgi:GPI mannosyltransferase 2